LDVSYTAQRDETTGSFRIVYSCFPSFVSFQKLSCVPPILIFVNTSEKTMVRIFSMYHFNGQMVDTVDDMSTLTVTDHNKLVLY